MAGELTRTANEVRQNNIAPPERTDFDRRIGSMDTSDAGTSYKSERFNPDDRVEPREEKVDSGDPQNEFDPDKRIEATDDSDEISISEKQDVADNAAQEYNLKYRPYDRAIEKGIDGIKKTKNGGVSFENTDAIFKTDDGRKGVVKIEATGNRSNDFDLANSKLGLKETPEGYVWHHVDNYNVKDGTITMELVKDEAHDATKPHAGGCAQYDAVNGASYNPLKKGVD